MFIVTEDDQYGHYRTGGNDMAVRTTEIIGVTREAYMYLRRIQRAQRGCEPLTEQQEDRLWRRCYKKGELKVLDDNSLGGGDGTYNGRWTSWNVETLRQMLQEGGYTWTELGTQEYITVCI